MSAATVMPAGGLLERDDEVQQLSARLHAGLAGEGSVVAMEGEAGIGKSELLACMSRYARDVGMRVLSARCGELERDFGYGVVRQLFDAPLAAMASEDRERIFSGAAGLAAAALSLVDVAGERSTDPGSVLHGLYWLTANLAAEQPLLVVVDDAHWADGASIAFLSYLARRIDGLALLVVYASRVAEGASDSLPARAEPGLVATVLRPGVLSEPATVQLIERVLGDASSAEFAHACRTATAGNPFLLQELLRALQADGIAPSAESCEAVAKIAPRTISRAIIARLVRLGETATQLAFATAVLGHSAELRHAAALADLELRAAEGAVDALTGACILRDGRPLQFIHPVVRTTVYTELPSARRAAMHRRAAMLLKREQVTAAGLAPHLMATEPSGDAVVVTDLCAAADQVRDRGANDAACDYLTRALAEPPSPVDRGAVQYALGSAGLAAGRADAMSHLQHALAGDLEPRLRLAAGRDFCAGLVARGDVAKGIEFLEASLAKLAGDGDLEAAMQVEGHLLCIAQLDPATARDAHERLARYEGRLSGDSAGERLLLTSMAFDAAHQPVAAAHAAELAELGLADGRLLLEQHPHAGNFVLATWTLMLADRLERADELYTLAVDHALAQGSLPAFTIVTAHRCHVRLRQGQIADAEAEARSCLESARDSWPLGRALLIACILDAMLERADPAACRAFLAAHDIDEDLSAVPLADRLIFSRGHMRLAAGDPAGALRDFEQNHQREQRLGRAPNAFPSTASAALALSQLGEHDRARELARQELERARVWGAASTLSFALRAAGTIAGGDEGIELLCAAAAAVEQSPAHHERALALTDYGAALRRAGHRRDAREPLREAFALADRCGAQRTAARARDELLASGARPRRAALSGADSLTPSERRVARLAADGRSNRDIAQTLFVTVRTVEGHLHQAFMKLDITRRDQLARALQSPAG